MANERHWINFHIFMSEWIVPVCRIQSSQLHHDLFGCNQQNQKLVAVFTASLNSLKCAYAWLESLVMGSEIWCLCIGITKKGNGWTRKLHQKKVMLIFWWNMQSFVFILVTAWPKLVQYWQNVFYATMYTHNNMHLLYGST